MKKFGIIVQIIGLLVEGAGLYLLTTESNQALNVVIAGLMIVMVGLFMILSDKILKK